MQCHHSTVAQPYSGWACRRDDLGLLSLSTMAISSSLKPTVGNRCRSTAAIHIKCRARCRKEAKSHVSSNAYFLFCLADKDFVKGVFVNKGQGFYILNFNREDWQNLYVSHETNPFNLRNC